MPGKENVLVIVDPSRGIHPALGRAIVNAQIREEAEQSNLIVMVLADPEVLDPDAGTAAFKDAQWFKTLVEPVEDAGFPYRLEVCWTSAWSQTMLTAIDKFNIDLVMLPFYGGMTQPVLSDEKWRYLRNSKTPVLLVRPGSDSSRKTILATVKMQDDNYQQLNRQIIERGKWAAERYNAQLHVVNAYSDSMAFPERSTIARLANVPNNCIHLKQGSPDEVIPKLAAELSADTILIGMTRRSGIKGALRGNTIEKIIDDVPQDIMMLV